MIRLAADRLVDCQSRLRQAEWQLDENAVRESALRATSTDPDVLTTALSDFDPAWDAMPSRHQSRVLQLLVQQIDYDGSTGKIGISFHPHSFEGFAATMTQRGTAQ